MDNKDKLRNVIALSEGTPKFIIWEGSSLGEAITVEASREVRILDLVRASATKGSCVQVVFPKGDWERTFAQMNMSRELFKQIKVPQIFCMDRTTWLQFLDAAPGFESICSHMTEKDH